MKKNLFVCPLLGMRMKCIMGIIMVCLVVAVFGCSSDLDASPDVGSYPPNIMLNDKRYWFVGAYTDYDMPDDYVLVGTVQKNTSDMSDENFCANGVMVDSEIYQSKNQYGCLFIKWDQYYNLFAVWELRSPLLQYDDTIYISANSLRSNLDAESLPIIKETQFSKKFQCVGVLQAGKQCTLPSKDFEVNQIIYAGGDLYANPEEESTVYVEVKEGDSVWREAFYNIDMIPIDLSEYQ